MDESSNKLPRYAVGDLVSAVYDMYYHYMSPFYEDAHRDPFEVGVDWLRKYSSGVSINPRLVPRLGKRGSAGEAQGPFRLLAPNFAVFNFLDLINRELHLGWLHQERSGSILAGFLRLKI